MIRRGAQRAPRSAGRPVRVWPVLALAAALLAGGLSIGAEPAAASSGLARKVVIVVGPTGSKTGEYITNAKRMASLARGYGAQVHEIYSPNATWSRVRAAAEGAHLLIYLGHGNGWPSPYGPFQTRTKDGFGLNASASGSHTNVQYYGEDYIRTIRLARYSVVILNRLCYASGNSEWGAPNPTKSVAIQRVDNYAHGFLRAGAKAVFADGIGKPDYIIYHLFRTSRTMQQVFWSASSASGAYDFTFTSTRYPGAPAVMDPYAPGRYYRSMVGSMGMTTGLWRDS